MAKGLSTRCVHAGELDDASIGLEDADDLIADLPQAVE